MALPQRAAGSRRSSTKDTRPCKLATATSEDSPKPVEQLHSDNKPHSDLPEYRTNAEQNQRFECQLGRSRACAPVQNSNRLRLCTEPLEMLAQISTTLQMCSCMPVSCNFAPGMSMLQRHHQYDVYALKCRGSKFVRSIG